MLTYNWCPMTTVFVQWWDCIENRFGYWIFCLRHNVDRGSSFFTVACSWNMRDYTNIWFITQTSTYSDWFVFCSVHVLRYIVLRTFQEFIIVTIKESDARKVPKHRTSDTFDWSDSSSTTVFIRLLFMQLPIALFDIDDRKRQQRSSLNRRRTVVSFTLTSIFHLIMSMWVITIKIILKAWKAYLICKTFNFD